MKSSLETMREVENQKPYNKFLSNLICSVCAGKYLPSVFFLQRPRFLITRSVRKRQANQANTFPHCPHTRLMSNQYVTRIRVCICGVMFLKVPDPNLIHHASNTSFVMCASHGKVTFTLGSLSSNTARGFVAIAACNSCGVMVIARRV